MSTVAVPLRVRLAPAASLKIAHLRVDRSGALRAHHDAARRQWHLKGEGRQTSAVLANPSALAEVFISYAHEDARLRQQLETHLLLLQREGLIGTWHDQQIGAGTEWHGQIDAHLNSARVIVLLVSADFLASDYISDVELRRAMEWDNAGEARVVPVIVRPVDNWQRASGYCVATT